MHSLVEPFHAIYTYRDLIYNLIRRDISGRYRGSFLGMLWSLLNPLLMLGIYTFVFSVVFQARWGSTETSRTDFALILFAGLMVFNLFSETINRAPGLVLGNVNYVKKVVFPLEILPIVSMGAALFQFSISFLVWLVFMIIFRGAPPPTIFLLPLILLPFVIMTLGFCWFLASIGVYVRDIGQIIGVVVTVLMFLSPLFYSVTALPEIYRTFMFLNPLTFVIEQSRAAMIFGSGISWLGWAIYLVAAILVAWMGFIWFVKTKKGFADVI